MTRRSGHGRVAFTLIEMLLVISIIALLMSLLLVGIDKVRTAGVKADTVARVTGINSAIGTFKSATSAKYIPSGQVDIQPTLTNGSPNPTYLQVIGPFRLMSQYPKPTTSNPNDLNWNCFEAQYIASLFPRATPSNGFGGSYGSGTTPIYLSANQTLLFFINGIQTPNGQGNTAFTGFSNNPQAPFTAATVGESRKGPYLELSANRYTVGAATTGAASFAQLVDPYGTPFAYFASYNGQPNRYFQPSTTASNPNWGYLNKAGVSAGTPVPYQTSATYAAAVASPATASFVNPTGWQIISAGKDGLFGTLGNWSSQTSADLPFADDVANFSTTFLGAGPN